MKKASILITFFFVVGFLMFSGNLEARLPDLTITQVTVNRNCNVVVEVKNNGPGLLPGYVYTRHHPKSAGVYIYVNGKPWGGKTIWLFDSTRKLVKPGGKAACVLSYKVGMTPIKVRAVVDLHNDVKEANEQNNEMTKPLRCKPYVVKRPDLTVSNIRLVGRCKILVTIRNIGTAGVPDSYYDLPDAVAVQMYNGTKPWGGMILKMFDPAGKLKAPGGLASHVWFPNAANLNLSPGVHTLKVIVDVHKKLAELKENNNELTKRVKCGATPPAIREDCISFNPAKIQLKRINNRWKIVEGNHWIFDFNQNQTEAATAFRIIKRYRMNQVCFVGRPGPSFQYLLVSGASPVGAFPGEDCVSFNPATISVKRINGRWKVVDGSHWMFDFGSNYKEARLTYLIIKKYGFTRSCFVGRPGPSFQYMRK